MIHMHFQSSDHVNGDVEHLQGVHNGNEPAGDVLCASVLVGKRCSAQSG